MEHKYYQEMALAGICPDCERSITPLSEKEIQDIKDDLGMDDTDDLSVCGDTCLQNYKDYGQPFLPSENSPPQATRPLKTHHKKRSVKS